MLSNGQSDFHTLHYLGSGDDTKRMPNLLMFTVQVNTRTCTVHYNHSIRCELNSLNFRATTSNLKGIYRFILNEKGRIQRLNGETKERKNEIISDNFETLCLPHRLHGFQCEMKCVIKWLILSGAALLLLYCYGQLKCNKSSRYLSLNSKASRKIWFRMCTKGTCIHINPLEGFEMCLYIAIFVFFLFELPAQSSLYRSIYLWYL